MKINEAQNFVKDFALKQNWDDSPRIDKFDHLHEELIEMSKLLRYKNQEERIRIIQEKKDDFKDGIGDLFFALCRLSNQLGVDLEDSFYYVKDRIVKKFDGLKESKSENRKSL